MERTLLESGVACDADDDDATTDADDDDATTDADADANNNKDIQSKDVTYPPRLGSLL